MDVSLLHWILFLPLVSAAICGLLLRRAGGIAGIVSITTAFVIAGLALKVLLGLTPGQSLAWQTEIGRLGEIPLRVGYLLDANAALMLFVVTFVGAWIHLFSWGYMREDDARGRFFAGLSLFMFAILGIVLADGLLMTFAFWELVGFCSYLLISHYYGTDFAPPAANKAFIANRIGDLGFILGIAACLATYGVADFAGLEAAASAKPAPALLGFLLLCGFIGKSAQFPLHVWLTDAMAGPTPVSALIHAATMVAAGVFLMARIDFLLAPEVLQLCLWSGATLAALAGLCALAQTDIKKSLAYSTLAHLGIMGAALGLGRPDLALLHMAMHAFFKATLFLGAGSVIHGCHHTQDMLLMGGLASRMRLTFAAFLAATLSNCALPFLAGWYSKDAILEAAHGTNLGAFALLGLAALATCLYSGRMLRLVFLGSPRSEESRSAHESPWTMTLPLVVLGLGYSIIAGTYLGLPAASALPLPQPMEFHLSAASLVGLGSLLFGLLGALWFYGRSEGDALRDAAPAAYRVLERRWMDEAYGWWIAKVQQPAAEVIAFLDLAVINGLAGKVLAGGIPALLGAASRRLFHDGSTRATAAWFVFGIFLIAALLLGVL
jgi:NADH-quinone oxidoreductase subunit L